MNSIILYLIAGVAFNWLWDVTINHSGNEEHRFNLLERLIVTLLWPFTLGFGIYYTIKVLSK